MEHVPDAILEKYADDPAGVGDAAIETHLASCETCREYVEAIRVFTDALRSPESWLGVDVDGNSTDRLATTKLADRIATENAEAEELVREMLERSPAGFVWENIQEQERFRTGGVVRVLAAEANKACEKRPRRALSLANAAVAIAETLPDNTYARRLIFDVRGVAWKECANAHRYLGHLPASLDCLARAERAFRKGPSPDLGVAIVRYVRAHVLYEQTKLDEALEEIQKCMRAFEDLHLTARYIAARNIEGAILYQAGRFAEARAVFAQVLGYGQANADREWIARASQNLGRCDIELGDCALAMTELGTAKRLFTELDLPVETLRAEAGIGQVMVVLGRRREGIQRLDAASKAFADAGMTIDAAITKLYAVEARLPDGPSEEFAAVAQELVKIFVAAGRLTGALAALAYVKELAVKKRLTPGALAYVREFLTRSERHPELAFAPPPDQFS